MLPKKYYDGFIIHDILSKHLDGKKFLEVLKEFAAAKAVDAEPVRHGKWIYSNDFYWYTASCNKCGYQRRTDIKADGWNQWNYCPNCGAKMDEERKE